jgi:hypothetical protein
MRSVRRLVPVAIFLSFGCINEVYDVLGRNVYVDSYRRYRREIDIEQRRRSYNCLFRYQHCYLSRNPLATPILRMCRRL